MKRNTIIAFILLTLTLILCGCGQDSIADNTIQPWAPEDQQSSAAVQILSGNGSSAFACYRVDESFKSVKIGIDYFKDGKLVKEQAEGSSDLSENESGAKPTEGITGFLVDDGIVTVGVSQNDGTVSSIDDIDLPGFPKGDDVYANFVSINDMMEIEDGRKVYLGIIYTGDDVSTDVLADPDDTKKLKGKTWLPYVMFSTKAVED